MSIQNVCSSSPASCTSSVSSYSTEAIEAWSGLTSTSLPEDSLLINILNSGGNNRAVMGAELQAVGLHEKNLPYANPYGLTENDLREYFHMNPRDSYYAYKKEE